MKSIKVILFILSFFILGTYFTSASKISTDLFINVTYTVTFNGNGNTGGTTATETFNYKF